VLKFYPALWLMLFCLSAWLIFRGNHVSILKGYVAEQEREAQVQVEELQDKVKRLKRRLDYN